MILLDRLLVGGLRFILEQLAVVADRELDQEGMLQEELLAAQMRLELGEISEEELAEIEGEILPLLRAARAHRQGWQEAPTATASPAAPATSARVVGIEVHYGADPAGRDSGT